MYPSRKIRKRQSQLKAPAVKLLMLVLIVSLFIFMLYPSLVVQRYKYRLGDIAERDIKAPQNFFIEDQTATKASRRQAAAAVLTVYDHDPRILDQIIQNIENSFDRMRSVIENLKRQSMEASPTGPTPDPQQTQMSQKVKSQLSALKGIFESQLGIEISQRDYEMLINEEFANTIAQPIINIIHKIQSNGVVANKEVLLKEINKGITIRNVANQTEKTVRALRRHYSPNQAKAMVHTFTKTQTKETSRKIANLIAATSEKLVQPNLTLNRNETETRKKQALKGVKPIMYRFKAGEMLVREGDRISAEQLLILQALSDQKEHEHIASKGFGAALAVAAFIFIIHVLYFHQSHRTAASTHKNLLFMGIVLVMVFTIAKMDVFFSAVASSVVPFIILPESVVYAAPAAAGAMLVCIFLGFETALPFSLVASLCVALLFGNRTEIFIYFFISNAMGAYWVRNCRERKVFIIAGTKLGLLNMLFATAASIYATDNISSFKLPVDWALAFSNGIASAIVAVGVAPLFELSFRYTTDITLLELANLDRPILRRLMLEAPGTYHHSVIVGSLVEAAAAEIGANPLLAKVCGYYHDIGKVRKPLYFIENQVNMKNKHDKLAPSMSSLILIAHVKDGIEIARKNKLGEAIIDTIEQHHGNSLISFFFNKAKQLKGSETVNEDDFRYPGPRPQTKEAGLVMLADVVEAASRTLENPTPAKIQGLVHHLVNKIFSEGQLDHCELTLKDLHRIAKSFNKSLSGIHHHRIEYSETATQENGKRKHVHPDRQPTGKSSTSDKKDRGKSPSHLKRLGLP